MLRRIIPISAFASLGYCERYFYMTQVLGVKPAPTRAMRAGARQHSLSRKLDEAKRFGREEIPALKERLRDAASVLVLPREALRVAFAHDGYFFRGQVDKLVKRGSEALVLEEKFVFRSYGKLRKSHEYQLSGYCHALKAGLAGYAFGKATCWLGKGMFSHLEVKYMVIERHRLTREVLFASQPKSYSAKTFLPILERAVGILNGEVHPAPGREAKCERCSLAQACEKTLR
jgi:CRISPR/Cas system-associated exonuclease Cas4 (RecB family)